MKILMLAPYLPYPPASGGQIRTFNLLKYLSRNHQVTLVCLYKNEDEKKHADILKQYCKNVYLCKRPEKPWQFKIVAKTILSFWPFLIVRNYSNEAHNKIKELLKRESFDVIHSETFYITPHIPKTNIPILLVEQTIEYKVYEHFIKTLPLFLVPFFSIDVFKLTLWEKWYWKKVSLVAAVSDSDEEIIKQTDPNIQTTIIPNGAGDEMFVNSFRKKDTRSLDLLFMGNFSWLQNVEAAEYLIQKVYPELKKKLDNFHIIIAGQGTKKKLKQRIDKHIEYIDLEKDGSDRVLKLYKEATVFIAPILGPGGTRLKILAAMAAGLPVITTPTGMQGLEVVDGKHILIARNPNEFAEKVKNIAKDRELYDTVRENAYKLAKAKYSWSSIVKKLEYHYQTLAKI